MNGREIEYFRDHWVKTIASLLPLRPGPFYTIQEQQQNNLNQARIWVDAIWDTAYLAGQVNGAGMIQPKWIVITDEQERQMIDLIKIKEE